MARTWPGWIVLGVALCVVLRAEQATALPWVELSKDRAGFSAGGQPFRPIGVNYDRDSGGRLIEDYWNTEWAVIEGDFAEMKQLGANVVRVHLQFGKFMENPAQAHAPALEKLAALAELAQRTGLYLNITGLACYHKKDVPAWYDALDEGERWNAQARFWAAVAGKLAESPAIFCYDLMNEPVVSGGKRKDGEWLGPAFGGKHFVQCITLDARGRPRPEVARQWIEKLTAAIRSVDARHLITVGLVDWSLDRKGLTSGFEPDKVAGALDFVSVHLYPEAGKVDEALETLRGFNVGKPVVIEETFPMKCSLDEMKTFLERSKPLAAGWVSFYWGTPAEELRTSQTLNDQLLAKWLDTFSGLAKRP